jgi:hypothetical protein
MHTHVVNQLLRGMVGGFALVAAGNAFAAPSNGWDWMIAPYAWAATVGTDVETRVPPSGISVETSFDDIVDKIDGAFQIHVEGEGDEFGLFADFTYLGLASERDRRFFHTETDLDARLLDIAAVWAPGAERSQGWHVFGGARIVDVDFSAVLIPANPAFGPAFIDHGEKLTDFMLGARYTWALSDRWGMTLRGDGSWGETDGTFNASVAVQYRTRNGAWLFGYRYLDVDLDAQGDTISITMHGPEIGYGFRF